MEKKQSLLAQVAKPGLHLANRWHLKLTIGRYRDRSLGSKQTSNQTKNINCGPRPVRAGIWPSNGTTHKRHRQTAKTKHQQTANTHKHNKTATNNKAQKQKRQTANKRPRGMQSPKHSWDRGGIACQTDTVFEEWVQWEATVSGKKREQEVSR